MSELILVRHGESEWNKLGLWTGLTDVELSEKGQQEALQAALFLSETAIHAAYTSQLKRAIATANRILTMQEYAAPLISTAALNERNYGIYTGKRKEDVRRLVGRRAFQQIRRSWDYPIQDGETLKHIHEHRIVPFHRNVAMPQLTNGQNVLVVSSNNPLRAYVKELENIPPDQVGDIELGTAEIRIYEVDTRGNVMLSNSKSIGEVH